MYQHQKISGFSSRRWADLRGSHSPGFSYQPSRENIKAKEVVPVIKLTAEVTHKVAA